MLCRPMPKHVLSSWPAWMNCSNCNSWERKVCQLPCFRYLIHFTCLNCVFRFEVRGAEIRTDEEVEELMQIKLIEIQENLNARTRQQQQEQQEQDIEAQTMFLEQASYVPAVFLG